MARFPDAVVAVVSPHLDDGVLSCGYLLVRSPAATAVTVFAGLPDPEPPPTPWDADCGFSSPAEAMAARWQEDAAALAALGTTPTHLPFADSQYGHPAHDEDIAAALDHALREVGPGTVAIPLGLFHSDHRQASRAAFSACRLRAADTVVYADVPYRALGEEVVGSRLAELDAGARLGECVAVGAGDAAEAAAKRRAVACYRSQLRGLATEGRLGVEDAWRPETYWSVTWER